MFRTTSHSKGSSIPVVVVFTPCRCHKCGKRLKIKKETTVYTPGMPGFEDAYRQYGPHSHLRGNGSGLSIRFRPKPSDKSTVTVTKSDHYYCPRCGNIMHYKEQMIIHQIQKYLRCPVLTEEEMAPFRTMGILRSILWETFLNLISVGGVVGLMLLSGYWMNRYAETPMSADRYIVTALGVFLAVLIGVLVPGIREFIAAYREDDTKK